MQHSLAIKTIHQSYNRLTVASVTVSDIDAHVFFTGSQCIMWQAAAADDDVTVHRVRCSLQLMYCVIASDAVTVSFALRVASLNCRRQQQFHRPKRLTAFNVKRAEFIVPPQQTAAYQP